MTDDGPQPKPDPQNDKGSTTNVGGVNMGQGSQITVGSGDVVAGDKTTAGRDVINVGAGATVIFGARPEVEDEAPAPGEPPFKGLQYFDENDAEWFFGREFLVAKLVGRLRESRFLGVIVGASGSGKSSVVRAGMIPALKRSEPLADGTLPPEGSARWPIHIITPTVHPLESLAASLTRDSESVTATTTLMEDLARDARSLHLAARKALSRSPANRLLVVVDQFEELFTLTEDEAERKAFVDNLIAATDPRTSGPTIVIITMRADFYAQCAQYANLRQALSQQQEYIGPMSQDELRRAIEEPAKRGDWEFEDGLVDLLLREVGEEPGALPLLSHALLETWKRRRGRKMTFRGYEESGGVRGAIAKTADAVYKQLDAHQQGIAKRIFLRLTELGEGQQDTRRRADLAELQPSPAEAETVATVLKKLVDARLVITSESSAEVAHEALIREWPTLREWLAESREGLRLQRQITQAAREWESLGRSPVDLFRGLRLVQAVEFDQEHPGELSALERDFLNASRELAEREQAEREAARQRELDAAKRLAETEKQRAEEQARAATNLRRAARSLTVAFVAAALMAVAAGVFWSQSSQQRAAAEAASTQAVAQQLTAEAASTQAFEQRALAEEQRAVAEFEKNRADDQRSLAEAASQRALLNQLAGEGNGRLGTQFDLALLLSVEGNNLDSTVALKGSLLNGLEYNPQLLGFLRGHTAPALKVVFSGDGKKLISAGDENDLYLWDIETRKGTSLSGHSDPVVSLAISPDGQWLASGDRVGNIILWDMTGGTPKQAADFKATDRIVRALAFSPDSQTLASTGGEVIYLWAVSDPGTPTQLTGHSSGAEVMSLAFSPDGKSLASGGNIRNNVILLWDLASGAPVFTFTGHTYGVFSLAFSPDGSLLASGGEDTNLLLWNVPERTLLGQLDNHAEHLAAIYKVAFSPNGKTLASTGADGVIVLWDMTKPGRLALPYQYLTGHNTTIYDVAFSPDPNSQQFASASADATLILWDLSINQPLGKFLRGHISIVRDVAFSPDGKLLASASNDPNVILWDAATGAQIGSPLVGHDLKIGAADNAPGNHVNAVAFSPDSKILADGGRDGKIVLWDVAVPKNPKVLSRVDAHTDRVWSLAFSSDGGTLFSGSEDKTIRVWNVSDPANVQAVTSADYHTGTVRTVTVNHDGTMLASSSADTSIALWDISNPSAGMRQIVVLKYHKLEVVNVAFSPDGRWLAAASEDGGLSLWDLLKPLEAVEPIILTGGHTAHPRAVAFGPDSKTLASGSADATVILWDVETRRLIGSALFGHTDWVRSLAFSPDGSKLASGSSDSTVILWDVDFASWQTRACAIVTRNLTQAEWKNYFGDKPYEKTCEGVEEGE
jgi:WD40 repeat protein